MRRFSLLLVAVVAAAWLLATLAGSPAVPVLVEAPAPTSSATLPPPPSVERAGGEHVSEMALGKTEREQALRERLTAQLRLAQQQPGDLQAFFAQLSRWCAGRECETLLAQVLATYPDSQFADLVATIQARLSDYEVAMASLVMSTDTPPPQRYQALRQVREHILGQDAAQAMFARQDRWADYQFAYAQLLSQAAYLSAEQRLQSLAALRQQHFAEDYPALQQLEGVDGRFLREQQLLLLGVDDPQQRAEITRQLRQQHYGDALAQQWQERDQQVAEQQRQVEQYQHDRAQLDQEMARLQDSLPDNQWQQLYQQRLRDLRAQYFE